MALGEVYNVKTILLVQKIATANTSCVHCTGVLRVDVSENYFAITITITIPGKEDIQLVRFGKGNRLRHRYIYRCHHSYNYTMLLFNFYAYKQMMFAKLTMFCSYRAPGIKEYLDNFLQIAKTKQVTQQCDLGQFFCPRKFVVHLNNAPIDNRHWRGSRIYCSIFSFCIFLRIFWRNQYVFEDQRIRSAQ